MPAQAISWEQAQLVLDDGHPGGLLHFFSQEAQVLCLSGTDMATMLAAAPEGQYGTFGDAILLETVGEYRALRTDHPAFGAVYAVWGVDDELTVAVYNYAVDISDLADIEITEQANNAIKGLQMSVQNASPDLFDGDMSLFSPGAALTINLAMGDTLWCPMGKYFLDTAPYDCMAASLRFQGRSRIGRLLKDSCFDTYGSSTQAIFTGTPAEICKAIITHYSDGFITEDEIVVQSHSYTYTAKFDPEGDVLSGLSEWLDTFRTPADVEHTTLVQGATGSEVTLAQKLLNNALSSYGATKLTVDGVFGAKMRAAVEKYQTLIGMYASGTVDADTWSALINGYVEVWSLEELYDGRIIIGNAAHIAKYRAAGRYTFTRDTDVITRSIDRSIDGAYSRIGVKYKSGDAEYYKYATIATWPGWSVPSHRTYYITAPSGATATQARDLANATAVAMQYVGVGEQVVGPIRPQLLVGDIAQISDDGGLTATVTGIITDITHRMGSTGYWTSFYTDSGGSIMEVDVDTVPTEATKPHPWVGRKQKISDAVAQIAKKVRKASALQSIE